MEVKFKVGDKVLWESQSSGSRTTKEGTVYKVIPPGATPYINEPTLLTFPYHKLLFDGMPRNHESYLVVVPGGKTSNAKPKLYWPRVSHLRPNHAQIL